MNTLVVGAGAVGQVLGAHLSRGGARVSWLVRPAQASSLRRGFVVRSGGQAIDVASPQLLTSASEAAAQPWDAVILTVSSPALRRGDWLAELGASTGGATVMGIQPGLEDPDYVAARVGAARVVWGMFPFMSYATADVSDAATTDAGITCYRPPLGALPLTGDPRRVGLLVEAFVRGGLPARPHPDVYAALAFGGALLDLHIVALECAAFRIAALRRDRALVAEAHAAIREALAVVAHARGQRPPLALRMMRPWLTRLVLRLAPRLLPFDLERYLRCHYTKVGDQTIAGLKHYITLAEQAGLPRASLGRLLARLEAARQPASVTRGGDHVRTDTVRAAQAFSSPAARDRPRA